MGFRFRKSINLGGGVKLNVSKKSVGVSAGVKGARVSVNSKGRKTTSLSIPGTGVSYVSTSNITKGDSIKRNSDKGGEINTNIEFSEEMVLKRSNEYKRISKVLFIIAILLFIAAFPLGAFVFLLSIVFIFVGVLSNIMGRFIKWQGLRMLNK